VIYHFGEYKRNQLFEENGHPKIHHISLLELNKEEASCQGVHAHNDRVEILYILEGEGYHTIGKNTYETKTGDLLIINEGILHEERVRGEKPLKYCVCAVTDMQICGKKKNHIISRLQQPIIKTGQENIFLNNIYQLLINESLSEDPLKNEICSMLSEVLIGKILDYFETHKDSVKIDKEMMEETENDIVTNVCMYLDQNFKEKISLTEIARQACVSPWYLERIFKKNTGSSVTQYMIDRRLGYAQNLLRDTAKSISVIAEEAGYDNPSYFSQLFKKKFGCNPGAYRKKIKKHSG
jgi:AraC-like DNA-binding protein/mannose-6-phosphate isomerase-like protein (cupin superfamily)